MGTQEGNGRTAQAGYSTRKDRHDQLVDLEPFSLTGNATVPICTKFDQTSDQKRKYQELETDMKEFQLSSLFFTHFYHFFHITPEEFISASLPPQIDTTKTNSVRKQVIRTLRVTPYFWTNL